MSAWETVARYCVLSLSEHWSSVGLSRVIWPSGTGWGSLHLRAASAGWVSASAFETQSLNTVGGGEGALGASVSAGLDTNTGEPKGHTCIYYYQQLSEGSAGVIVSEAKMTHGVASAMKTWDMCLPPSKHFVQRPLVNKRPSK